MSIHRGPLILLAAISAAALAGEPPPENNLDPGEIAEQTGRLEMLLDRATETTYQLTRRDSTKDCATRGADFGLKQAAIKLSYFVGLLQGFRLAGIEAPKQIKLPAWVFEPPGCPTLEELRRRDDWLEGQVFAITDPVCAKAADKTGDQLICSVE